MPLSSPRINRPGTGEEARQQASDLSSVASGFKVRDEKLPGHRVPGAGGRKSSVLCRTAARGGAFPRGWRSRRLGSGGESRREAGSVGASGWGKETQGSMSTSAPTLGLASTTGDRAGWPRGDDVPYMAKKGPSQGCHSQSLLEAPRREPTEGTTVPFH